MMNARCHSCGRPYLAARADRGKSIACRSCGALNDAGGGPPPAPPSTAPSPSKARQGAGEGLRTAGPAFTVGSGLPGRSAASTDETPPAPVPGEDARPVSFPLWLGASALAVALVVALAAGLGVWLRVATPDRGSGGAALDPDTMARRTIDEGTSSPAPPKSSPLSPDLTSEVRAATEQDPIAAPEASSAIAPPAQGSGTKASQVELLDGIVPTVYASSLIGLREFDKRFLTNRGWTDAMDLVEREFVNGMPLSLNADPELFRDILRASLLKSFLIPPSPGEPTIDESRPLFEARLAQVPADTRVGVYLDIDASMRRYLALPQDGLVSRSADIRLATGGQSSAYRHDAAAGMFRVPLDLPWNDDELHQLQQAVEIPYSLRVRFDDGSEDRVTGRVRVNPVAQVEMSYPFGLGFAALVDETHPWIRRVIDEINQRDDVKRSGATIAGAGGSVEEQLQSIALIWQDLTARGLRYQNLSAAEGHAQRCRLVHESLGSANANCIDGTVLLASFLEATGIDSYLVLVPGHAFVMADLDGTYLPIETTKLGEKLAGDPSTEFDDDFRGLRAGSPLFRSDAVHSFEAACAEGDASIGGSIEAAKPVLEKFRSMEAEFAKRQDDEAWKSEFFGVLDALSRQIKIVPVALARQNGVRPVGAPSNLDQLYRLPPRR